MPFYVLEKGGKDSMKNEYPINASGYKQGKWKTYVGDKRKEVI